MILHVDMDAFYASVEERDEPQLHGRPVIVGGSPNERGVVSAANYLARKFGVQSAMPAVTARRLCPQAAFLRPRIQHYAAVSREIHEIFHRFTPLVEPLSLDEAFLDVAGSTKLFGSAIQIGRNIKSLIAADLNLVASVGVAPNKFLAKIASDLDKPDGFVIVDPDRVDEFLGPLPVSRLWGVGKVAARVFQRLGIERIEQLRRLPLDVLQSYFGRTGEHLWRLAHGIDQRPVVPDHTAKSISHETTFAGDVEDMQMLKAWLMELTEQVARRLRRNNLCGRTVNLKLRYGDFHTITRSSTLPQPTNLTSEIWQAAAEILSTRLPERKLTVRLLGVGVSGIERTGCTQQLLFDRKQRDKNSRLDEVTDRIQERFGKAALGRAIRLETETRQKPASDDEGNTSTRN